MATCWLVDRRQSKHGQTAPTTSTESSVDQGCEGPPRQPDKHASRTLAEHAARAQMVPTLGVTHRLSRFTRVEFNAAFARLPVTRPAWMTYRGPSMTQRIIDLGILIQALTAGAIPQQWQKALVVQIYKGKGSFFGSQQLQPDQPAEQSSCMVTTSQPGCPSSRLGGRHRAGEVP